MEFRLIFDGHLPANGDAGTKMDIRRYLHPQLRELWKSNKNLYSHAERHGAYAEADTATNRDALFGTGLIQLAKNWNSNGFNWLPLVAESYCLTSSLEILFLRKGGPGNLLKNGDIDGRIKTLFDALQKPQNLQELGESKPANDEDPFFCLFENDI